MINKYFKSAFIAVILSAVLCLSSCSKHDGNIGGPHTNLRVLLDSAKSMFLSYDAIPNSQKLQSTDLLENSIALLTKILKSDPNNAEANYYMGYATELDLMGGTSVLNFDMINRDNTETISNYFEKARRDTSYAPDYKLACNSKIANLWTTLALNYMIKGVTDSVETAFARADELGSFTPANLEYAKNVLNDLDRNAVLFVDTDLETSLFWFLQYMMNYRADVSIVSTQMLDYQWYAKWLGFPANFTTTVETGFSESELMRIYSDTSKIKAMPEMNIAGLHIKVIGRGNDKTGIIFPVNDRVTLGIINKNLRKRPIYFTVNAAKSLPHAIGFGDYVSLEGMAVSLHDAFITVDKSVDGQWIADRIINHYSLSEASRQSTYRDRDFSFFSDIYRMIFDQEFYYYAGFSGGKKIPDKIVSTFNRVFPQNRFARTKDETALFKKLGI